VYSGKDTFATEALTNDEKAMGVGAMAVIALYKSVKNPEQTTVTFDNYYTGLPLLTYLQRRMHIDALGTVRRNRLANCPLTKDKDFLKRGRGASESQVNKNAIVVVQWADNKCVCLASTFVGVEPATTIERYCDKEKRRINVPCPKAVQTYNATMGGVDLSDMFMALYAIPTRARRWYFPLIGYAIDLALTNAWILYKRDCDLLGIKRSCRSSKEFRLDISLSLMAAGQRTKGRPSLDKSLTKKKIKHPVVPRPSPALTSDGFEHWPLMTDNKGRCRYCKTGYSRVKCSKCNLMLCFNGINNCFLQFHLS
jgi:hypothetical protein